MGDREGGSCADAMRDPGRAEQKELGKHEECDAAREE